MASASISAAKGRYGKHGAFAESDGCPGNGRHRAGEMTKCLLFSGFSAEDGPQESQTLQVREGQRKKGNHPLVVEGWVRDGLNRLNTHKSVGP